MKKIAVIGYGYVGKAVANMFKDHYEVRIKDECDYYVTKPDGSNEHFKFIPEKKHDREDYHDSSPYSSEEAFVWEKINACDLIVVCVPTPMGKDNRCDTSIVTDVVEHIYQDKVILIKSTIAPGTSDALQGQYKRRIVFSPEYAGESKYWSPYEFDTDMRACPFVILGGHEKNTQFVLDIIAPVLGPTKSYYQVSALEAEIIKYAENAFYALKVTYANELRCICENFGADFYKVRNCWLLDPRVNPMHTMAFPDNRGFGGKCFPKDVNAIVNASKDAGYRPRLLEEVLNSNERFRAMNPDAEKISKIKKVVKKVTKRRRRKRK